MNTDHRHHDDGQGQGHDHGHGNGHDHGGGHGHHAYAGPTTTVTLTGSETVYDLEAAEINWEIAPGRTIRGYGLNGQIPGPVIEARQGEPVAIRLTNHLPEATVVHWHGLRVPSKMDGTDDVQRPIQPGETFTYLFTPPDAGTFWYHSHANETEQIEKGLYGAFIVRGEENPGEPTFDGERILVLDDMKLEHDGAFARFGGFVQRHDGREGEVRLVNGQLEPELRLAAGQIERWRIINASSARYIRLSIGGRTFHIIGTGGGFIEAPVRATAHLLPPSDRVDLAVGPFEEGDVISIDALAYHRGSIGRRKTERFATVVVGLGEPSTAILPARLRTIEPIAPADAAPTRTVKLSGRLSFRRGVDFFINDEQHHHAEPVRVGELQVWDLVNTSLMDHPFHLHGFFFQVLSVNETPPAYRSWADVVNVPPRCTVRIAWLPDNRPGRWMYHCHILEHHAQGMMAHFDVE